METDKNNRKIPKKINISGKAVLIAVLILAVIAAAGIFAYSRGDSVDKEGLTLTVMEGESRIARFSLEEIRSMNSVEKEVHLSSGSKDDVKGKFTGVPLKDILNRADKSLLKDCNTFIIVAGDGYSSAFTKKEIEEKDNVIVAYYCDGEPLGYFTKGGTGPMRLIVLKDTYGNRSTKYMVKIICKR